MNWTVDDVKRYVQKRLREEERTRTKLAERAKKKSTKNIDVRKLIEHTS